MNAAASALTRAGVLAVALVGASPADVLRHGHDRPEVPADPGRDSSTAVARPIRPTRSGSAVAPRPTLCGKIVAPTTLFAPWTASTP